MNFGERAGARKKAKDNRKEIRQLGKRMLEAGCDKNTVHQSIKCFQDTLELADRLCGDYEEARAHLTKALEKTELLLEKLGERPKEEDRVELAGLVSELTQVYHECSIREDDLDFHSSVECFRQISETFPEWKQSGMSAIMLRSELENMQSVLKDAAGWSAPDFFALAYYELYADSNDLKEMENGQRNQLLAGYVREHFFSSFVSECVKAGILEQMREKWPQLPWE